MKELVSWYKGLGKWQLLTTIVSLASFFVFAGVYDSQAAGFIAAAVVCLMGAGVAVFLATQVITDVAEQAALKLAMASFTAISACLIPCLFGAGTALSTSTNVGVNCIAVLTVFLVWAVGYFAFRGAGGRFFQGLSQGEDCRTLILRPSAGVQFLAIFTPMAIAVTY